MRKLKLVLISILITSVCPLVYAFEHDSANEPVYQLNEVDTPPKVIKALPPRWPKGLRIYEGYIRVKFVVTKEGKTRDAKIIISIPNGLYNQVALEAVQKYRFKPAMKGGKPVGCSVNLPIEYQMEGFTTTVDAFKDIEKGKMFIKAGDYDKAIEAFTKAIKIYDVCSDPNEYKSYSKKKLGKYAKLVEEVNKAIMNDPHRISAYFLRGETFRNLGKYSEAIADFSKIIELNKGVVQAYNNRAFCYNKLKDTENMCPDLKKACGLGDCRGEDLAIKAGKCSADTVAGHAKQ